MTGAIEDPKVVHQTNAARRRLAWQVTRIVGRRVDPSKAETRHHEDQCADEACVVPLCSCDTTCQCTCLNVRMMNMTVRTPVITVMTACIRMIRSKTHDAADDDQRRDDDHGHGLDSVAAAPTKPREDRRGREHGDDGEHGLPPNAEQPGDERRKTISRTP